MRNINFLIVEDSTLDFIVCKSIIEKHYSLYAHITTVTSLQAAIKEMNRDSIIYDIVLLDLNVEDSKGISTLEKFSEQCSAPIIIYSAASDKKMINQAILHGADGYIIKGEDSTETIIENINHALENQKFITQRKKGWWSKSF